MGILLNSEQKAACQQLLNEVTDYHYVMKGDERRSLSAIYIAVATERVTLDKLMMINDVSRNTILNDLAELREELSSYNNKIQLHATKAKGYYFDCHPMALIQYLYKVLAGVYQGGNSSLLSFLIISFLRHKACQPIFQRRFWIIFTNTSFCLRLA